MKRKWSIYAGGKFVDSGTIEAESDKDALAQVMLDQDGKLDGDTSYRFTAGELSSSSYGDELRKSARVTAHGLDETNVDGGYLFQPKPSDIGIDVEVGVDWSGDASDILADIQEAKEKALSNTGLADRVVGHAMENAAKGDMVHISFLPGMGFVPGEAVIRAGTDLAVGEAVRMGAHGRVYSATRIAREKLAGRRTFTPQDVADLVLRQTGRGTYTENKAVWTQDEVDELMRQLRCPAVPPGPHGAHDWVDIPGTLGRHPACEGLGLEKCRACGNQRTKRRWPKKDRPMGRFFDAAADKGKARDEWWPGQATGLRQVGPQSFNMPPTKPTPAPMGKAFSFNPIMDKHVREVAEQRANFAAINNVAIEQVEVTFIHDEVRFSLKD